MPTEPSEPPATTHTVTFRVTYSASYGYTVKTMTVEDGYVLTAADYPTTYGVTWEQYTSPITSDVTVNGTYSWGGYGAAEEAEAAGEIPAEVAAESTAVSRTGSTTLVKTVTETYDYVYNGGRLSQVKKTTSTTTSSGTTNATDTLNFTYDANGTPMAVKYNGTMYYFVTNVQGDVTAILNTSGTAVASYTYDAWGNILTTGGSMASTLGTLNPLRYRGYVYDTETGLYYLQSRYYNPARGRFLNADAFTSTRQGLLGNNMFAYWKMVMNDFYVKDISRKIRSGINAKIDSGDYIPSASSIPYGYIRNPSDVTFDIDPETAPIVCKIFEMRASGMALNAIATVLNKEGYPSPGKLRYLRGVTKSSRYENANWLRGTIRKMLCDPVYIGNRVHGKIQSEKYGQKKTKRGTEEWHIIENAHPARVIDIRVNNLLFFLAVSFFLIILIAVHQNFTIAESAHIVHFGQNGLVLVLGNVHGKPLLGMPAGMIASGFIQM